MVAFCGARTAGARPGRSDDGRDGVIGRRKTLGMAAGSAGKTEEHRGVGDHVGCGGAEVRGQGHHVKTHQRWAVRWRSRIKWTK